MYASFFKNIYLAMNYRIKKEFDDFALLFRQRLYDTIQAQSIYGIGQRNPPPIAIEIVSLLTRSLFEKNLPMAYPMTYYLNTTMMSSRFNEKIICSFSYI